MTSPTTERAPAPEPASGVTADSLQARHAAHMSRSPHAVVNRKTVTLQHQSVHAAIRQMRSLGEPFHLFTDRASGRDAVVRRRDDGRFAVAGTIVPPDDAPDSVPVVIESDAPLMTVEVARERIDAGRDSFIFFRDPATRRGHVLYRRADGEYALIAAR
jgi:hypothetical protein